MKHIIYTLLALLSLSGCKREIIIPERVDTAEILSGTGEPAETVGKSGDFYINTDDGSMYGPKTDEGWGQPINDPSERLKAKVFIKRDANPVITSKPDNTEWTATYEWGIEEISDYYDEGMVIVYISVNGGDWTHEVTFIEKETGVANDVVVADYVTTASPDKVTVSAYLGLRGGDYSLEAEGDYSLPENAEKLSSALKFDIKVVLLPGEMVEVDDNQ